jgi:nicotinamidase-related amidase
MAIHHTAVLTMELQRGVCGDLAPAPHLSRAVDEAKVATAAMRLVDAARQHGVTVVHCMFTIRGDGAGTSFDSPLMAAAAADPTLLRQGQPSAELLPGLGPEPGDLVSERHHGLTPFTGTDLGDRLRSLGVTRVVACGVSLNVGIPGLAIEAVGEGFSVVVATDAVVGLPKSFGDDVVRHALAYVGHLATVDELIAEWSTPTG